MTREQVVIEIIKVRSGHGINRETYPEQWKGSIAKKEWHDGIFSIGFEYGYIYGLMVAYDITPDEVESTVYNGLPI